jgi:GNAT superfamily N-acetyltransferase
MTGPEHLEANALRIEIAAPEAVATVRDCVLAGLTEYNGEHVPAPDLTPFVLAARGAGDQIIGGLSATMPWADTGRGWLMVHMLWVAVAWRGRGVGHRLLQTTEAEAVRRGCRHACLDTYEFQARAFYEREGYVTFGVLEGFPPGSRRYSMRKGLGRNSLAP